MISTDPLAASAHPEQKESLEAAENLIGG